MHEHAAPDAPIWRPGWHVARELSRCIRAMLAHPAAALEGARVLDFGCGTRPYEPWFRAAGAHYQGADLDGAHEVAIHGDGALAAEGGSVDIVASFQVLEHVPDVERYLSEAHRVLKPGGRLLLSTHGTWFYHPHPGDYRRWTGEGLRLEIEPHGFAMVEMRAVVGPLAWTSILRSYGLTYACRRLPLVGGLLSAASSVLYNLGAWLADRITPDELTANNACVYVALFRRGD